MRINTNVSALNAQRNLSETQRAANSSMSKLSSGLRIAKAGDDAAGLAISNKLRASTRTLSMGAKNAEQGNAMLAIAEGSAQTIQKILERQKELVAQKASANVSVTVNLADPGIDSATTTLAAVDTAITNVNTLLGDIGSAQNRLDYTLSNLKTAIQNQSAAESVIRDVDMAEEMATFTKNNILAQAGQAMLAQANQSSQGVLQLLRG